MLRLRTLGGLSVNNAVFVDGAAARRRPLAVLAILAVHGQRGISRDKLSALLWPESDQDRSAASLRQALTTLRSELGERDIVLAGTQLRLNPDVITSDVEQFEAHLAAGELEAAVDSYAGPFLDGVFLRNSPEFEQWVEAERLRLSHSLAAALETLANRASAQADRLGAVSWWRRLAAVDRSNGRIAHGLMTALAAAGDPAAALQHFRIFESLLREEFDALPAPELIALAARLRETGPHLTPRPLDAADPIKPIEPAPPFIRSSVHPHLRSSALPLLAAALILAAAFVGYLHATRPDSRRVLVAVLQNETGDSSLDVVGQMASDWITHGLAVAGVVDVVDSRIFAAAASPDSARPTRERALAAVSSMAHEAGAGMMVWGRYYREGDSLHFQLEVTSASSDAIERVVDPVSAPVDRPDAALDQLRQKIMGTLAAMRDPRLATWATVSSQPPRYDAYAAYVRGVEATTRRDSMGLHYFITAARLDTSFVEATLRAYAAAYDAGHSELADSLFKTLLPRRDQLDPFDQADFDAIAAFSRGDYPRALVAARRMAALGPASQDAAFRQGWAALNTLNYHEAITAFRHAEANPGWMNRWSHFYYWADLGYHLTGDYDGELALIHRGERKFPDDEELCLLELRALIGAGELKEMERKFGPCNARDPNSAITERVAEELLMHGHPDLASRYFDASERLVASRTPPRPGLIAQNAYQLGRWRQALDFYAPRVTKTPSDLQTLGRVGVCYAMLGDGTRANAIAARIVAQQAVDTTDSRHALLWRGRIAGILGRRQESVDLISEAIARGISPTYAMHFDPTRLVLQGFPGYDALLKSKD